MKYIFLDIDGVLKEDESGAPFLPESLAALKKIVDKTGAEIVMSSTWKVKYKAFIDNGHITEFPDILRLYNALSEYGLEIHGYTPYLYVDKPVRRPTEIKQYLNGADDIEAFCILDDRTEFLWDDLTPNFVCTVLGYEGDTKVAHLTERSAEKAIEILDS